MKAEISLWLIQAIGENDPNSPVFKLFADVLLNIVSPIELLLVTGSLHQRQCTSFASLWLHTDALTFLLRLEAVSVALTSAVPEARASTVFAIEEPAHSEVSATASFSR